MEAINKIFIQFIKNQDIENTKLAIDAGANVNCLIEDLNVLHHLKFNNNFLEFLELLCSNGIDVNQKKDISLFEKLLKEINKNYKHENSIKSILYLIQQENLIIDEMVKLKHSQLKWLENTINKAYEKQFRPPEAGKFYKSSEKSFEKTKKEFCESENETIYNNKPRGAWDPCIKWNENMKCSFCDKKIKENEWFLKCECGKLSCGCTYYAFGYGNYQSIKYCGRLCWENYH